MVDGEDCLKPSSSWKPSSTIVGQRRQYDIQSLLEEAIRGKLRHTQRAIAVGPGPINLGRVLEKDFFVIYYRVEEHK